jgi:hypothetical protein
MTTRKKLSPSEQESEWQPLQAALKITGISRTSLFDLRRAGVLQPGRHWLFSLGRPRSPILWNVQAIRDWQMAATMAAVEQQADETVAPETYSGLPEAAEEAG